MTRTLIRQPTELAVPALDDDVVLRSPLAADTAALGRLYFANLGLRLRPRLRQLTRSN
ncbi:hypothetical protein OG474_33250 [Kribbella sp. NBC_01505]|uniref:hypothetical protein n=1 Tax=Kribbella sp. NBC_01505 TaxID=2903580 RepID=UPI003863D9BB